MVITQDKAVFVWVISLNFHSKNFSLLFCKLDLTKIHPTQQDLICTVMVTAKQTSISYFFDICCWKKTKQKTHGLLDLLFGHQILSLDPPSPFAILSSSRLTFQQSRYPFLLQACFGLPFYLAPTFTLVNPAAFSPTLGTNNTNCLYPSKPLAGCKDAAVQASS